MTEAAFLQRIRSIASRCTPEECWVWDGYVGENGYGRVYIPPRTPITHRVAYTLLVGPIPTGLTIDHLCRNRACINPAHMEPVTQKVNTLRGIGPTAKNTRKTHCIYGHPFSGGNLILVTPIATGSLRRICRACQRRHCRERYYRNKGKKLATS